MKTPLLCGKGAILGQALSLRSLLARWAKRFGAAFTAAGFMPPAACSASRKVTPQRWRTIGSES